MLPMLKTQMDCLRFDLMPRLKEQGIEITSYNSLSRIQRHVMDSYFAEKIFPVLTPLAVDPSHPFPYISPSSLNLGLTVEALTRMSQPKMFPALCGSRSPHRSRV